MPKMTSVVGMVAQEAKNNTRITIKPDWGNCDTNKADTPGDPAEGWSQWTPTTRQTDKTSLGQRRKLLVITSVAR